MGIILELANESNAKLLADLVLFDSFKDKVKPIDGIPQSGWYATMDRKISIRAGWNTKMGLDILRKVLISIFIPGVVYDSN